MKYYAEDKPSLDSLAHFGVKGMRWGVRKAKPSSQEIKDARGRVALKEAHLQNEAGKALSLKKGTTERAVADKKVDKLLMDFLQDPDQKTAAKMTQGEKFTVGLGIAVGLGSVALTGASRRL